VIQFLQSVVDGLFYEICRLSKGKRRIGDDRFADVKQGCRVGVRASLARTKYEYSTLQSLCRVVYLVKEGN
jgi:hypothetical protein